MAVHVKPFHCVRSVQEPVFVVAGDDCRRIGGPRVPGGPLPQASRKLGTGLRVTDQATALMCAMSDTPVARRGP